MSTETSNGEFECRNTESKYYSTSISTSGLGYLLSETIYEGNTGY